MCKHTVSSRSYLCFALLLVAPMLFAADTGGGAAGTTTAPAAGSQQMGENKHFDSRINTWAEGTVSSIDYDHNSFVMHGKKMPFATAHAQMRKEFKDRMKNADPAQREKIAADVRQEWQNKLEDARKQTANETDKDFNLKFARDGKVMDASDFPILSALRQRREMMQDKMNEKATPTSADSDKPKLVGEMVIVEIYEVPQNASFDKSNSSETKADGSDAHEENETAAEEAEEQRTGTEMHAKSNLTFRDIKAGDKVMCGFDNSTSTCYMLVRGSKTGTTPTSTQTTPSSH